MNLFFEMMPILPKRAKKSAGGQSLGSFLENFRNLASLKFFTSFKELLALGNEKKNELFFCIALVFS